MEYMGGWLRVRVPLEVREAVDRAAEAEGLTTSLWVRRALVLGLGSEHIGKNAEHVPVAQAVRSAEALLAPREPEPAPVQPTPISDKVERMYRNQGRQI